MRTNLPISCERTISHNEKHERLEKIALSAMKQCGRSRLPQIQPLQNFNSLMDTSMHYQLKFILHEKVETARSIISELKYYKDIHSLLIVVGPEGGFTEEEITCAVHAGFKSISLGTRRLRTETSAVAAISHVLV